mmetsp:Transcript_66394/g.210101  ORF Transcript_66394/g.210101 Transcript_66394/m.210101 type:complete len:205 (+) Transcript_66394:2051-2665(+)
MRKGNAPGLDVAQPEVEPCGQMRIRDAAWNILSSLDMSKSTRSVEVALSQEKNFTHSPCSSGGSKDRPHPAAEARDALRPPSCPAGQKTCTRARFPKVIRILSPGWYRPGCWKRSPPCRRISGGRPERGRSWPGAVHGEAPTASATGRLERGGRCAVVTAGLFEDHWNAPTVESASLPWLVAGTPHEPIHVEPHAASCEPLINK